MKSGLNGVLYGFNMNLLDSGQDNDTLWGEIYIWYGLLDSGNKTRLNCKDLIQYWFM
jgi:hypothetical protein